MELLKRTEEYRVETEDEAKALIQKAKDQGREEGYEVTNYSSTHKIKKDDDYFLIKITKVW